METVGKVGDRAYPLLKRTAKWANKDVGIRETTVVYRILRRGHVGKNGERAAEEMGECSRIVRWFGPGCFVVGTPVLMADGSLKPIETVQEGEEVLSKNEVTGEVKAKKVLQTFQRQVPQTLSLVFQNGEQIVTTAEHPFYVLGKGFVPAANLDDKSMLLSTNGVVMSAMRTKNNFLATNVFNLEVEDFHTYFVGQRPVWVHNTVCGLPSWKKINVDWEHIFSGHMVGGSRVSANKDLFPENWTQNDVMKAVQAAYESGKRWRTVIQDGKEMIILRAQMSNGRTMEIWVNKTGKAIETAYPLSGT